MYQLIVVLAVIVAVLLAIIVLIQESKGGGLASNVAGANSVLGVRKTTDFVEKATWTLAGLLVVFAVASSFFVKQGNTADDLINNTQSASMPAVPAATPGQPAPAEGAAPATPTEAAPAAAETPAAEAPAAAPEAAPEAPAETPAK